MFKRQDAQDIEEKGELRKTLRHHDFHGYPVSRHGYDLSPEGSVRCQQTEDGHNREQTEFCKLQSGTPTLFGGMLLGGVAKGSEPLEGEPRFSPSIIEISPHSFLSRALSCGGRTEVQMQTHSDLKLSVL